METDEKILWASLAGLALLVVGLGLREDYQALRPRVRWTDAARWER